MAGWVLVFFWVGGTADRGFLPAKAALPAQVGVRIAFPEESSNKNIM